MDLPQIFHLGANQFGRFNRLIDDYLEESVHTTEFFSLFPKPENFEIRANQKLKTYQNRSAVFKVLKNQLSDLNLSAKQTENLKKFGLENSVTVTTGHQLNLFTGPLYFFYKILQTIKSCKELNAKFPDYNFLPVFWMATEDHDFAEINHFYFKNQKFEWKRDAGGIVGKLDLGSLKELFEEFKTVLPESENAKTLFELIEKSYLNSENLKEATQKLVQNLFGEFGLLMIDGDDTELKKLMIPAFERDLTEHSAFQKVEETNQELTGKNYSTQVNPREINLFYLGNGNIRERIVSQNGKYFVLDSDIQFSREEILEELKKHPEKFSPNVILRPLFQETVLPNIAYIGGSGEIAYWLQLKSFFDSENVLFPILIVRNSLLILNEKQKSKLEKLNIDYQDLFKPLHQILNENVMGNSDLKIDFEKYENQIQTIFSELKSKAIQTDVTFGNMVNAQQKKQLDGLAKMQKRLIKAEKIKNAERVERIENLYNGIFPNGSLQERTLNFSTFWLDYGKDFVKEIYNEIHPFEFRLIIKTLP